MEKAYVIWRGFQDRLLAPAAGLLLIGCTLMALLEVVRRYAFGFSFEWQQDLVTYATMSGVYLYFGIAQRNGSHLNVTLLTDSLDTVGPRCRAVAEIVRLVALVFFMPVSAPGAVVGTARNRGQREVRDPYREPGVSNVAISARTDVRIRIHGGDDVFPDLPAGAKLRGRTVLVEPAEAEATGH